MPSPPPGVQGYPESAVLIAGGTSGVGLASALAFADAGVRRLALVARDPERGHAAQQAVARHCPDAQVVFVAADACDPDQVQAAVSTAHQALGRIDVLVSSVTGSYRPELLHRTPMTDIAAILLAQALPPMHLTRAVLPIMAGQGGEASSTSPRTPPRWPRPGKACSAARWPPS